MVDFKLRTIVNIYLPTTYYHTFPLSVKDMHRPQGRPFLQFGGNPPLRPEASVLPPFSGGGGHSRLRERGVGES
jgi:hypothetical protein